MTTQYRALYSPNQRAVMDTHLLNFNQGDIVAIGYPRVYTLYRLTEHKEKNGTVTKSWSPLRTEYKWD
jgi:hypothetical protein